MNKVELRKSLKSLRNQFTDEQVSASSVQVWRHILACDAYRKAKRIMGYLAFGAELSVDDVLRSALDDGKEVYVPYIISKTEMYPVRLRNFTDFVTDRYGIRSIVNGEKIAPELLDLVLVPAVAYDKYGGRMGMGAGYYDRFLPKAANAVYIGVAYDALMQERLICDEFDVSVPFLVSESGIRKAERRHNIFKGE